MKWHHCTPTIDVIMVVRQSYTEVLISLFLCCRCLPSSWWVTAIDKYWTDASSLCSTNSIPCAKQFTYDASIQNNKTVHAYVALNQVEGAYDQLLMSVGTAVDNTWWSGGMLFIFCILPQYSGHNTLKSIAPYTTLSILPMQNTELGTSCSQGSHKAPQGFPLPHIPFQFLGWLTTVKT